MDWYLIFKWLHVSFAIIWLGGAFIMLVLGAAADRARDDTDMVWIARKVAWSAERVYVPASILTLIFGLLMSWTGALWSNLWIILGLLGIASTIYIGIAILTPRAKKVEAGYAAGGVTPQVLATCRELLAFAKFDITVLFVVVADIVLKPQADDWVLLAIMAAVILAAGAIFLRPRLSASPAAA